MANTKQAKKMIRKTERKTSYNRWWKRQVKDAIKTLDEVVAKTNPDQTEIQKELSKAQKTIDKAAKNGVFHKNRARRMTSSMAKKISQNTKKES